MSQRTALQGLLQNKCPHCREGKVFTDSPFSLTKYDKANTHCPVCETRFEKEPGFFYGAMYVSYAFSVAILIGGGIVISFLFKEPSIWLYMGFIAFLTLITFPFVFRASRLIWLYFFMSYDPNAAKDAFSE